MFLPRLAIHVATGEASRVYSISRIIIIIGGGGRRQQQPRGILRVGSETIASGWKAVQRCQHYGIVIIIIINVIMRIYTTANLCDEVIF